MRYAILCYDSEAIVGSWTKAQDDALMAKQAVVERKLAAEGKLGPVVRLMPTTAATTLRKGAEPLIIDGPFAETKEQLLGFYIVDCASLHEVIDVARLLAQTYANGAAAQSFGVSCGRARAMAVQRSSMVRAAAFFKSALNLENAVSMGLRSGEYGGR
jgi:hypothetical protein